MPRRHAITMRLISETTGHPLHRVRYVVRTRRILPMQTAGRQYLFSRRQMARIATELDRARRDPRGDGGGRPRSDTD